MTRHLQLNKSNGPFPQPCLESQEAISEALVAISWGPFPLANVISSYYVSSAFETRLRTRVAGGDLRMSRFSSSKVRSYLLYALGCLAFCGFCFRLGLIEIDGYDGVAS